MIYITGDTHGDINRFFDVSALDTKLTENDTLIICGDFGFVWFDESNPVGFNQDNDKLDRLSHKPYTILFIDGNHALTEITNTNAKNGTILLIKDSFSHSLAPFLAENYSKVVLVDLRYYKESVSDLVTTYNPEQVVVLYGIDNLATDTDIVWLK